MTSPPLDPSGHQMKHLADPRGLLNRILQNASKLMPFDAGGLAVWDVDNQQLVPFFSLLGDQPTIKPDAIELGVGVVGTVAQTRQPFISGDVTQLDNYLAVYEGIRSEMAVPILLDDRLLGVIDIESRQPDAYTDTHLTMLQALADQAALVLETTRLYQTLAKNYDHLQQSHTRMVRRNTISHIATSDLPLEESLPRMARLLTELAGAEACAITLWDTVQQKPRRLAAWGIDEDDYKTARHRPPDAPSLTQSIVEDGEPVIINQAQSQADSPPTPLIVETGAQALMALPLVARGRAVGAVFLMRFSDEPPFTQDDIEPLQASLDQISLGIDNRRLLDETRASLRETSILLEIASITASTLELDDMLADTVRTTADLLQAEGALLLLPGSETATLHPHQPSAYGVATAWQDQAWPLDDGGPMGAVYHQQRPYYLNNTPLTQEGLTQRNILSVPLTTVQETLGVLSLINRRESEFQEEHARLAQAIASHIAVNMQSARRFTEEQQRARLMGIANQISQELTASLDPSGLMRRLAQLLHERLDYEYVVVIVQHEEGYRVEAQAGTGHDSFFAEDEMPVTGVLAETIGQQQVQAIAQQAHTDPYLAALGLDDVQSALLVPLRRNQVMTGVVVLASTQPRRFQDIDREIMDTLAPQISSSLENSRLYTQAQRRLIQQGIVQQIGQDLAATLNYSDLMQSLVRHMARALDTSSCLVAVYSPRDEMVRVEADYRLSNTERASVEPLLLGSLYAVEARPAIQKAIQERRTVIVYRDDERVPVTQRDLLKRLNQYSQMVVPMVVGDRVIGVVDWMESRRPRVFTAEDERLAMILVSQASVAVENARLFRESERRATQQTMLRQAAIELGKATEAEHLFDYLIEVIVDSLQAENVAIAVVEHGRHLRLSSYYTETIDADQFVVADDGLASSAPQIWNFLQNGYTVTVEPTIAPANYAARELKERVRGYAGMVLLTPITQRGQLLGVIEVMLSLNVAVFDTHLTQMLESLADQTAIAINNILLYQREQRRLRQIERVQASGRLISSELHMPDLLTLIVEEAARIFELEAVSLDMPDADDQAYIVQAWHGLSDRFVEERRVPIPAMQAVMQDDSRIPVYIDYASADNGEPPDQHQLLAAEGIKGVLNVALVRGDEVLGFLRLYHHARPDAQLPFTEQDKEIAQLLASQVTIALENAQLFHALEERAYELAEANRLKSSFLATMSHELRTPMNSILGFSNTLLSGIYGELNEKQASRVERILKNGRNLLALIDDLLDLSKIEAGRMEISLEPTDIKGEIMACMQAIESQAQEKGITLASDIPADVPLVMADSLRLKQIINNLLSNAVKFTAQGQVAVEVTVVEENTSGTARQMVYTSVSDTGIGIKPDDQEVIFDEFRQADSSTTREFGGTGLGLAICKRLLQMMDGEIWVESKPSAGSTFTFTLPVASQEAPAAH